MNKLQKVFNLFKRNRRRKYIYCFSHRTWISRQVQEEQLKHQTYIEVVGKEENWYDRYL